MLPLSGIKVLDLTNFLPGPYCTMLLGDLGAEVIKIERPKMGDPARVFIPGMYETMNRNKKSITLNLKDEKAREILFKLAKVSDVFIESFRPGVCKRLGIDYESIKEVNRKIIYCSISGYGQTGPYRDRPGHDINYLGTSGLLYLSGDPDGPPQAGFGIALADLVSSLFSLSSILCALIKREKDGEGVYLDVSMTDCTFSLLASRLGEYYSMGKPDKSRLLGKGAYGPFKTKDGKYITIGCLEDKFFENLLNTMGLSHLLGDERFSTWRKRGENRKILNPILSEKFLEKTAEEWLSIFEKNDVPSSPVNDLESVFLDPQIKDRDLFWDDFYEGLGSIKQIGFPVDIGGTRGKREMRAPKLGENTEEILLSIGYAKNDIEIFREKGVI